MVGDCMTTVLMKNGQKIQVVAPDEHKWILWCGNTASPAGRELPVRTNGNRLCEFNRVMPCLIHIPHALRCHAQHLCL